MFRHAILAALVLVAVAVTGAQAQDVIGRVERIEPEQRVIVLANGQMYRITPTTVLYVNSHPVMLNTVTPGQTVVIRAGEPVMFQNGQYVVVSGMPAAPAAPPPTSVVVAPPATAVPAGVRQTIYGRIEHVDNDGTVKVSIDGDDFKVKLGRDTVRQFREGDRVQIDLTVVPPGTPAASPR
jgi:preprotein translocase subunit YajC